MSDADPGRRAFISYARPDRERVSRLAGILTQMGWPAWFDDRLLGGQPWWNRLLAEIRRSDVVVLALSPASLASEAVRRETEYARALGISVLPVLVDDLDLAELPQELAEVHIVHLTEQTADTVPALAAAIYNAPPRRAPDGPPPPEPPAPVSPLAQVSSRVRAEESLSEQEQFALVAQLAAAGPEDRDTARSLLEAMRSRRDLLYAVAGEVENALNRHATPPPAQASPATPEPPAPAWSATANVAEPDRIVLSLRLTREHVFDFRCHRVVFMFSYVLRIDGNEVWFQRASARQYDEFTFPDGGVTRRGQMTVREGIFGAIKSFELRIDDVRLFEYP